MIKQIENILNQLNDGDMTFTEAGDWLHMFGDDIIHDLDRLDEQVEDLQDRVRDLEYDLDIAQDEARTSYDEGYQEGYNDGENQ